MDSHGCLSSLFCIVCQNKWTVITTWVISSALSVRINGQSWLLGFSFLQCPSDQMDRRGCLRYLFCIVRQNKWTVITTWVLFSTLSVRSNGPTWLLTCLLFSTQGSGRQNRPTLRHTSLSGTVASLPQSAPEAECLSVLQNQSLHKHKTYIHKHQTQIFEVSPFNITPVKRAHKARTCWYRRPFRLIYRYQVKEKYKKGMDRRNIKLKNII